MNSDTNSISKYSSLFPQITVVVPVKDEEDSIQLLILEICNVLRGVEAFEIIYIDDGSVDGTHDKLKELMGEVPELISFRHRVSCGQSSAIVTGVKNARGSIIVTLDGDGQNDPKDIITLLSRYSKAKKPEEVLIIGHRVKRMDTLLKRWSSHFANSIRRGLLGDKIPDTGCGLKVFSKSMFLEFPVFDHMHRFMPALTDRFGGIVISVPVNHRSRKSGNSKYGTWYRLLAGIIDILGVIWLKKRGSLPQVLSIKDELL